MAYKAKVTSQLPKDAIIVEIGCFLDRSTVVMAGARKVLGNGIVHVIEVYVLDNDARELNDVPDNTVDIVVTSPPYGDSRTTVAYGEFSRVSLQWMDLDNIDQADITGIDKSLMGGDKYRKGFEYNLKSDTLKKSLTKILEDPKIWKGQEMFIVFMKI